MLPRRNVLIFHLGALGDFILTWPLALALGRIYPQSRIYYVTHQQKGALAEKVLRIESADIEGGWHHLFAPDLPAAGLPDPANRLLASAHSVFSFLSDGQDAWAENVKRLAPEAELTVLRGPRALGLPPADALLAELATRPVVQTAVSQMLSSIASRGVGFRRAPDGSVVIHPGAGSPAKCWPLERFVDLGRRFRAEGRAVRFVIGETERERWPAGQVDGLRGVGEVVEPANYLQLLDALQPASLFVGNDSGPGHLAGMIGVPTFSIFGPTDPNLWKALGPSVRVMREESLEALSAERAYEWIVGGLGKPE